LYGGFKRGHAAAVCMLIDGHSKGGALIAPLS